ncbi:MAG: hypothetical protein IJ468_08565 [Lachnospiraceae bacterium]|nr:hypothetical protein [Lachnospiraceae bacterium]
MANGMRMAMAADVRAMVNASVPSVLGMRNWRHLMISREKVERMTEAALLQKQGERGYMDVCKYRRRDYIALHLVVSWLCCSAAYVILTGILLLYIYGKNPDQYINLNVITQVAILWGMIYLMFCLVFCWITYLCYSERYDKAALWQVRYLRVLRGLKDYYYREAEAAFEDDGWTVRTEKGKTGRL